MTFDPSAIADGRTPSHHWVAVPDETEPSGFRTIAQPLSLHEARSVARNYVEAFGFIRSVPVGQGDGSRFFWVHHNWEGRVIASGWYGADADAEFADWLADYEQVMAQADAARDEAISDEIDERKMGR